METTLILLKPDAVEKNLIGELLSRFEKSGFTIRGLKMMPLTEELLAAHYSHVKDRSFYPRLLSFMQQCPVVAVALGGPEVISKTRAMIGPTDSEKAPVGTIRGDYGTDATVNVCHASDSPETAAVELARFFSSKELF